MSPNEALILAGLLHDIGKFRQRTRQRSGPHKQHSRWFVEERFAEFFYNLGGELSEAIARHHRGRQTEIDRLLVMADWLASQEREVEEREQEAPSYAPLVAITARLQGSSAEREYPLKPLEISRGGILPVERATVGPADYGTLWDAFEQEFATLAGERAYTDADLHTILALLHKYTSRMPSATPWERSETRTVPDVSLYDHLRTTAAIAACLYREVLPDEQESLLQDLRKPVSQREHADRPVAALVKGDISGIQDFLYLLTSEGAARGLRGRSFYLQMLTEVIARWLLRALELPVTNLLLASGGHFYLLVPHRQAEERLPELTEEIIRRLWQIHQDDLSLIIGWEPVCLGHFESFSDRWDAVSRRVQELKRKKWAQLPPEEMFAHLFEPHGQGGSHERCDVCHREGSIREEEGIGKCQRCRGYEDLGKQLRTARYLIWFEGSDQPVPNQPNWRDAFAAFGAYLVLTDEVQQIQLPAQVEQAVVYTLNSTEFLDPRILRTFQWERIPASYDFRLLPQVVPSPRREQAAGFEGLAQAAEGVHWLGVLRMDVDNLGNVFRDGLEKQASLSRMATLSEAFRLFFEGYVPHLCHEYNNSSELGRLELIYAGGDDLFLVGSWDALPEIAYRIRSEFREFMGGDHVTLSGGIFIEHLKYPLYQFADAAGEALEAAKSMRAAKNMLYFMGTPIPWERYDQLAGWHQRLFEAVTGSPPLPRGFLTRLSEIAELYRANATAQSRRERKGEIAADERESLTRYSRWAWQLVYHLSQASQRMKQYRPLIDDLRRELIEGDLMPYLHLIARWTHLKTRSTKED